MIRFSKVTEYRNNPNVVIPTRSTSNSAGYDFTVPVETVIPSIVTLQDDLLNFQKRIEGFAQNEALALKDVAYLTKETKCKPTLVPTGIKCYLEPDTYLQLSVRSSCPLKHWLILANGVGIIDSDYVDNPDNEGHIFFQIINLSPFDIKLQPGDVIGQGIIQKYITVDNDSATGNRIGGFGSTNAN